MLHLLKGDVLLRMGPSCVTCVTSVRVGLLGDAGSCMVAAATYLATRSLRVLLRGVERVHGSAASRDNAQYPDLQSKM
jgi:hypothetical protein